MRWSIRYQLFTPLLILLLGVVGISTWTALASAGRARLQIEQQVRAVVHTLSDADFPLTPNVLELMKGLSGADFLVVEKDGRAKATLPIAAESVPNLDGATNDWRSLQLGPRVVVGGQAFFCTGMRLRPAQAAGGGTLYVLYPEAQWREAQWEAVRPSLVLGAFGGLASVALTVGVAQRLSRRIRDLERRTRVIAAGDFSPMELPGRADELRDLGQSINDMTERLAQLQQAVQKAERLRLLGQVSGGLAHQLRNGVSGARLAVQLHARECHSPAVPEALEVALRQLALVEVHLKRFLHLGRTEGLRQERCSLRALIDETVALLWPQCRHVHIDLRWQPPAQEVTVIGDPSQLGHLLFNVVSNAVEAASAGGWVDIRMCRAEPKSETIGREFCVVEVADSGPGPTADVAARLFEPFVTGKGEGVGLGLAVARQVVEAHGGTIDWRRAQDRTVFRIQLPVLNEAPHESSVDCR
jgi:signal transduction histidine kinase